MSSHLSTRPAEGLVPRSGGPSAKTFHRAGSPNHQNDSKENPMLEPPTAPAKHPETGGFGGAR
jgi:hypothetical protein